MTSRGSPRILDRPASIAQRLGAHLSYANVMATIAVFIALGGGAYAAVKLGKNAVKARNIAPKAVKAKAIAPGAVSGAKLAPGAVSGDKIASCAVSGDKIATGAVSGDRIATGAVSGDKIATGAIGPPTIAPGTLGGYVTGRVNGIPSQVGAQFFSPIGLTSAPSTLANTAMGTPPGGLRVSELRISQTSVGQVVSYQFNNNGVPTGPVCSVPASAESCTVPGPFVIPGDRLYLGFAVSNNSGTPIGFAVFAYRAEVLSSP